jgi:hypothetical protein
VEKRMEGGRRGGGEVVGREWEEMQFTTHGYSTIS